MGWLTDSILLAVLAVPAGDTPRFLVDRTGVNWTFPFTAAQAKAARESRLLFVKPIAFGTDPIGGW